MRHFISVSIIVILFSCNAPIELPDTGKITALLKENIPSDTLYQLFPKKKFYANGILNSPGVFLTNEGDTQFDEYIIKFGQEAGLWSSSYGSEIRQDNSLFGASSWTYNETIPTESGSKYINDAVYNNLHEIRLGRVVFDKITAIVPKSKEEKNTFFVLFNMIVDNTPFFDQFYSSKNTSARSIQRSYYAIVDRVDSSLVFRDWGYQVNGAIQVSEKGFLGENSFNVPTFKKVQEIVDKGSLLVHGTVALGLKSIVVQLDKDGYKTYAIVRTKDTTGNMFSRYGRDDFFSIRQVERKNDQEYVFTSGLEGTFTPFTDISNLRRWRDN
ncbi:MAG: hypothetical protein JWQ09_246 [Segetibacter sp.]|nr:hypothetical protein [Segetibacter sp.]